MRDRRPVDRRPVAGHRCPASHLVEADARDLYRDGEQRGEHVLEEHEHAALLPLVDVEAEQEGRGDGEGEGPRLGVAEDAAALAPRADVRPADRLPDTSALRCDRQRRRAGELGCVVGGARGECLRVCACMRNCVRECVRPPVSASVHQCVSLYERVRHFVTMRAYHLYCHQSIPACRARTAAAPPV